MSTPSFERLLVSVALVLAACGSGDDGAGEDASGGLGMGLDAPDASADSGVPPPVEVPEDAPTVLFLSDSIGAGLHLAEHQAFPSILHRRLAAAGRPFHLINASESGRTSAGGVGALDWTLGQGPDVVVIGIGGNDGLRGVPLAEVEKNLRTMIERSQDVAQRVVLLGVRIPENYGDYAREFDALYPALAAEYATAFVPYYMEEVGLVPELNLADGMHPSAEGHGLIAQGIEGVLAEVLDGLSRPD